MFQNLFSWLRFIVGDVTRSFYLRKVRARLIKALISGDAAGSDAAWKQYQAQVDTLVKALPDTNGVHARAEITLILAKAHLWLEAKEPVRYLQEQFAAILYAERMNFDDLSDRILATLNPVMDEPEYLQACGLYEEAVDGYNGREQLPGLSNRARGFLNLRLAECFLALLEQSPDNPNQLRRYLDSSLQTALVCLDGLPEQGKALQLFSHRQKEQHHVSES